MTAKEESSTASTGTGTGSGSTMTGESVDVLISYGARLYRAGNLDGAEDVYRKLVQKDPGNLYGLSHLGLIAAARSDNPRAHELLLRARAAFGTPPSSSSSSSLTSSETTKLRREVDMWLGVTCRRMGRLDESRQYLEKAAAEFGGNAEVRYHAAMTCLMTPGGIGDALSHLRHSTSLSDKHYELYRTVLAGLGEWNLLLDVLNRCRSECSLAGSPTKATLLSYIAETLYRLGRHATADGVLQRAIAASSETSVGNDRAAFRAEYTRNQRVMTVDDEIARELTLLRDRFAPSSSSEDRPPARSVVQTSRKALERCDWDAVDETAPAVLDAVRRDPGSIQPFSCLTFPALGAAECRMSARAFARKLLAEERKNGGLPEAISPTDFSGCGHVGRDDESWANGPPLVVGVFSTDFRPHPMASLLNAFFSYARSSANLEVVFFHKQASADYLKIVSKRVRELVDCNELRPHEIAVEARKRRIQVWLETTGYTGEYTAGRHLFHRPAPVVASWAGFAGTMGAPGFVHYIVADEYALPPTAVDEYDESPIRVPTWLIADPGEYARPADEGRRTTLRERVLNVTDPDTVVYASLGRLWKISRDDIDRWCRIATSVPTSVFWLLLMNSDESASVTEGNIRNHWTRRCGLDAERLRFTEPFLRGDHLSAWRAADVALGTSMYNAGATSLDAVFSGVPLVHIPGGDKIMERAEGSVLSAAGLHDDLVAKSSFEYVRIAASLGTNGTARAAISDRLGLYMSGDGATDLPPLFDPAVSIKALGRGMHLAFRKYCSGDAPSEIPLNKNAVPLVKASCEDANDTKYDQSPQLGDVVGWCFVLTFVLLGALIVSSCRDRKRLAKQKSS